MSAADREFWLLFALFAAIRVVLAATTPLFGDEAFYWQESQRLALGYSDLPAGTALLIRASSEWFGHGLLALRLPFVLAGLAIPLLLREFARRTGLADGNLVGTAALLLPIMQALGVLAIPDAGLALVLLGAVLSLLAASQSNAWRHWIGFGLLLACAWLLHWRAAMIYFGGLAWLIADARSRSLLSNPRHWLGQLLGLLGLLPALCFNAAHDWPALRFQALERHQWSWSWQGLLMPIEQAILISPWMFALLLFAVWRFGRDPVDARRRALALIGGGVFLAYFLIGWFADQERTRVHWPLPAFLPLLLLLGAGAWRMRAMLGLAAVLSVLMVVAISRLMLDPGQVLQVGDRFGANFLGFREVTNALRAVEARAPFERLIADNFLLAAELDWHLAGRQVHVLDQPRNREHGRAAQLTLWGLDEASLRADLGWQRALLVVDDSALYAGDRFEFYRSLCDRLGGLHWLGEVDPWRGHRRFTLWRVERSSEACQQPVLVALDEPAANARVRADALVVGGWAIQHLGQVSRVELWIDDRMIAAQAPSVDASFLRGDWPRLRDRNAWRLGFRFEQVGAALSPGTHRIHLRAFAEHGMVRRFGDREIEIVAAASH